MAWLKTYETALNKETGNFENLCVNKYAIMHESEKFKIARYASSPMYALFRVGKPSRILDYSDNLDELKEKADRLCALMEV